MEYILTNLKVGSLLDRTCNLHAKISWLRKKLRTDMTRKKLNKTKRESKKKKKSKEETKEKVKKEKKKRKEDKRKRTNFKKTQNLFLCFFAGPLESRRKTEGYARTGKKQRKNKIFPALNFYVSYVFLFLFFSLLLFYFGSSSLSLALSSLFFCPSFFSLTYPHYMYSYIFGTDLSEKNPNFL